MTRDDPKTLHADNRGVVIGGDATGSTIVTGDQNQVHSQVAISRDDFLDKLGELRQDLEGAGLPQDDVDDLQAELDAAEKLARREKPRGELVVPKLKGVLDVLKSATSTGKALVPPARQLVEWAEVLFRPVI